MSTLEKFLLLLLLPVVAAAESPQLGQPLTEAEVELVSYTVMPDGEGLPEGSGSAIEGADVYRQHCMACHGATGEGGLNDRLVGGQGSIAGPQPVKTVGSYWPQATTLFDYIRRAMPYTAPGSLNNDEIYAVTAYLLYLNDIVEEQTTLGADSLPRVRMPNRENFVWAWAP